MRLEREIKKKDFYFTRRVYTRKLIYNRWNQFNLINTERQIKIVYISWIIKLGDKELFGHPKIVPYPYEVIVMGNGSLSPTLLLSLIIAIVFFMIFSSIYVFLHIDLALFVVLYLNNQVYANW